MKSKFKICYVLILFVLACDKPQIQEPFDTGSQYFPVSNIEYLEYVIDTLSFDPVGQCQILELESRTQARFRYADSLHIFSDTLRLVHWEQYDSAAGKWEHRENWMLRKNSNLASLSRNNLQLLKMKFPLLKDQVFQPTQFIDPETEIVVNGETIKAFRFWEAQVLSLDQAETLGQMTFDEVLTIQYVHLDSEIEYRYGLEKYAKGIGLIYREEWIMDTQCCGNILDCRGVAWKDKAEKGYFTIMHLTEYKR